MAIYLRVILRIIKEMEEEWKSIRMVNNMRENGPCFAGQNAVRILAVKYGGKFAMQHYSLGEVQNCVLLCAQAMFDVFIHLRVQLRHRD